MYEVLRYDEVIKLCKENGASEASADHFDKVVDCEVSARNLPRLLKALHYNFRKLTGKRYQRNLDVIPTGTGEGYHLNIWMD